jgi:hypothetical protein
MPPGRRLGSREIALLRRWIDSGAAVSVRPVESPRHSPSTRAGLDWWSLQPLRPGPAPGGAASSVDAFIVSRLRQAGLTFAAEARRPELIRRLTFDLHGLPPTPEEISTFVSDPRPDAYERLVDRLLGSHNSGERMARHWLDVARFAESDGFEHDLPRPEAWRYRDWVIDAFNQDLPYDDFVRQQLAGDALAPDLPEAAIPTGFLVAGGFDRVGATAKAEAFRLETRLDELEEIIGATSQAFLGLTVQCARCHDHKFDPITQEDYYRVAAVFAGSGHYDSQYPVPRYVVRSDRPPTVRLLRRGSPDNPGPLILPGGVAAARVLPNSLYKPGADSDPKRRLALAGWITDPRNPLPRRVMANRLWSWIFGTGLVATPNDLGFNGDRPSHPELLDWLAGEFQRSGGSWKRLVRTMVLSRTYRQSADRVPLEVEAARGQDAENRLLWRRSPRRLEAEELRDAMLATAGALNPRPGGPGFALFSVKLNAGALYAPEDRDGEEFRRRTIYQTVVRAGQTPLLATLDCPDPSNPTPRREASSSAPQALGLLNDPFVARMAARFADRLEHEARELPARIERSTWLAWGRSPSPGELALGVETASRHGLPAWCRVLFNSSEFMYLR